MTLVSKYYVLDEKNDVYDTVDGSETYARDKPKTDVVISDACVEEVVEPSSVDRTRNRTTMRRVILYIQSLFFKSHRFEYRLILYLFKFHDFQYKLK